MFMKALQRLLKRLQVDYVDSLIIHNPPSEYFDGNKNDHYEILEKLIEEGKIKAYGASIDTYEDMKLLMETTNSKVIEAFFNIFHQDTLRGFEMAKNKEVGIIVKIPLDSGWLTGKYNAESRFNDIRSRWSKEDIKTTISDFKKAAENAVEAGFDGIEIHSSNGYLFHQFFNNSSNKRTDNYGGSIENRARFLLAVIDKAILVWGNNRVGVRLSPYGTFNDMKEIVSRALEGRLDIEQAVTEKTDGQNIFVTWKNNEIGFARGVGTIINPMTTSEIIADFQRKQQKAIAEKGADAGVNYQRVVDAYQACAEDLTEAFGMIPADKLNEIFKNGRVFANMEIIYPATKNVITYDKAHLQFHNLIEYDEAGNVIQTDLGTFRVKENSMKEEVDQLNFTDDEVNNLKEIFDLFDRDRSGYIDIKDLETIMGSL